MAQPVKVKGLVIRQVNYGDYDKMLTVLTEELGKISVSAKGIRSMKNKNRAACELLCFSELVLKPGKNDVYTLSSSEPIESFFRLREDVLGLALGVYMADITGKISPEGMSGGLKILLNSLYMLTEEGVNIRIVKLVFELKALSYAGYTPETEECISCGENSTPYSFSAVSGGVLCRICAKKLGLSPMGEESLNLMRYIINAKLSKGLFKMTAEENVLKEAEKYVKDFIRAHIFDELKSLTYFEKLVNMP